MNREQQIALLKDAGRRGDARVAAVLAKPATVARLQHMHREIKAELAAAAPLRAAG